MRVADQVFERIVADILSGALKPNDHITERALVERLGASRTPVREALKRLQERGLLSVGRKGVSVVRDFPIEEIRQLYSLRLRMERAAAVITARRITREELLQLRRINLRFAAAAKRRDLVGMLEIRAEFHAVATGATRNRFLAEILAQLREKAYVVRHWHWQELRRASDTIRLHDAMIDALERRDGRAYRRLVEEQIRAALDAYTDRLIPVPAEPLVRRRRALG